MSLNYPDLTMNELDQKIFEQTGVVEDLQDKLKDEENYLNELYEDKKTRINMKKEDASNE